MKTRVIILALPLLGLTSCGTPEDPRAWLDQIQPTSPCYRVDLLDGLDESSTTEVDDLFACLNRHDHFESLQPFADTWSQPTRSGRQAGVALASSVNGLTDAGVDVFGLVGVVQDLVQSPDEPIAATLDIGLEVLYGRPAVQARDPGFDLDLPANLERGLLTPLEADLPAVAGGYLNTQGRVSDWLGEVTQGEDLKRWIWTLDAIARSSNPDVVRPTERLLPHVGELIQAAHSPWNDRSSQASGDSLRDVAVSLAGGPRSVIEDISPEVDSLLSDATVRAELQATLVDLEASGVLRIVPDQAAWLATVNVNGQPRAFNEPSALEVFTRLFAATNQPMDCSVGLGWFGSINIHLGNVSVSMAGVLADQNPWVVDTALGMFSSVLDFGLTDWALEAIANSDNCSAFTPQVYQDLQVLDLMREPQTDEMLGVVVSVLHVAKHGQTDHIPEVVDLITVLYDSQAMPAVSGAVADLEGSSAVQDLVGLVPVLASPRAYGLDTPTGRPANLQDALIAVRWVFHPQGGVTGWQRLQPVARPLVEGEGVWLAAEHAAEVLTDPRAQLPKALELVPALLDADPELKLLDAAAPVLASRAVGDGLAEVLERPEAAHALLSSQPVGDATQAPQAFGGRLLARGALDDLLALVDRLFASLSSSP